MRLIFLWLFGAVCAVTPATAANLVLDPGRLARASDVLKGYVDREELPGFVVLVSQGETILLDEAMGRMDLKPDRPMRKDAIFRLRSMTKPITMVAALIAYEQGLFLLDDPVTRVMPELSALKVHEYGEQGGDRLVDPIRLLTFQHLMSHTSGIVYGWGDHPSQAKLREADPWSFTGPIREFPLWWVDHGIPLKHHPGEDWTYGMGHDILAGLIDAADPDRSYEEFLQEEIFGPLGMIDTGFQVPGGKAERLSAAFTHDDDGALIVSESPAESGALNDPSSTFGGHGLTSTARDYWRFARMLLNGGVGDNGVRILSPKSVELMLSNHMPAGETNFERTGTPYFRFSEGYGFGLGVAVMVDVPASHNVGVVGEATWSGALLTFFWVVPEIDVAMVVMTQYEEYIRHRDYALRFKTAVYHALVPGAAAD